MRVLITWGSKRGGTEGIARTIGEVLRERGHEVFMASAERVVDCEAFDAVVVGGALYANRWPSNVRRFVRRHVASLRKVPVWFFSSGPLDASADHAEIPPSNQVAVLAERVGVLGHVTFGGRLAADAEGFPASAMAKTQCGDFRNPERIRQWAAELAERLPTAQPGKAVEHAARSLRRLVGHAVLGWAGCTALLLGLLAVAGQTAASVVHALVAPVLFAVLAFRYFRGRGAREPLAVAFTWVGTVALLDTAVVVGVARQNEAVLASVSAWLPLVLIFVVTWLTGALMSTLPWPKPAARSASAAT